MSEILSLSDYENAKKWWVRYTKSSAITIEATRLYSLLNAAGNVQGSSYISSDGLFLVEGDGIKFPLLWGGDPFENPDLYITRIKINSASPCMLQLYDIIWAGRIVIESAFTAEVYGGTPRLPERESLELFYRADAATSGLSNIGASGWDRNSASSFSEVKTVTAPVNSITRFGMGNGGQTEMPMIAADAVSTGVAGTGSGTMAFARKLATAEVVRSEAGCYADLGLLDLGGPVRVYPKTAIDVLYQQSGATASSYLVMDLEISMLP